MLAPLITRYSSLITELMCVEALIQAFVMQKLVICAELAQFPAIQHEDQIGVLNDREAVSDDTRRPTDHQPFERSLNQALGLL